MKALDRLRAQVQAHGPADKPTGAVPPPAPSSARPVCPRCLDVEPGTPSPLEHPGPFTYDVCPACQIAASPEVADLIRGQLATTRTRLGTSRELRSAVLASVAQRLVGRPREVADRVLDAMVTRGEVEEAAGMLRLAPGADPAGPTRAGAPSSQRRARRPASQRAGRARALPEAVGGEPDVFVHYEERVGAGPLCREPRATLLDGDRRRVTCPRCKEILGGLSQRHDLTGVQFWGPLPPDENVKWEITGRRAGDVWNAVVVEPIEEAGTPGHFTEREIRAYISMEEFRARRRDEQAAYFAALPEGSIVHYHHGVGRWVRARAVRVDGEIQLQPEALVGRWDPASATSYWIDRLDKTHTWRPHWTSIYESGKDGGRWQRDPTFDPRGADPVDLATLASWRAR